MSDKNGGRAAVAETGTSVPSKNNQSDGCDVVLVARASERLAFASALAEAGHQIVGEASEPGQAVGLARALRPCVVLIHASLFPLPSFEVTRTLTAERMVPVIWFGEAEDIVDLTASAIQAGAMGFLSTPLRSGEVHAMLTFAHTRFREIAQLEAEVKSLNERMEARKLVGRAKALLMERFRLTERDAFRRIQAQSAALNKPVHEIARAIITASEIAA